MGLGVLIPAPAMAAPVPVCALDDERLTAVTGLTGVADGFAVVAAEGSSLRVFFLDQDCKVTRTLRDTQVNPFDPEDLSRTADGALWVADIGDKNRERTSISVYRFAPESSRAVRYRFSYPEGAAFDAEAMIITPAGLPIFVTKDALEPAGIYVPVGALKTGETIALRKAGELRFPPTGTEGGPVGRVGQSVVTGGALSPDGSHVVLRTYTDAYEFAVTGGDVVSALTGGKKLRTPLPGERQGQSIAYSADGNSFVTAAGGSNSVLQRWAREVPLPSPSASKPVATESANSGNKGGRGFLSGLSLRDLTSLVVGVGIVGFLLSCAGAVGVIRHRSQRSKLSDDEDPGAGTFLSETMSITDTDVLPRITDDPSSRIRRS
jgi:hypothetical protein